MWQLKYWQEEIHQQNGGIQYSSLKKILETGDPLYIAIPKLEQSEITYFNAIEVSILKKFLSDKRGTKIEFLMLLLVPK